MRARRRARCLLLRLQAREVRGALPPLPRNAAPEGEVDAGACPIALASGHTVEVPALHVPAHEQEGAVSQGHRPPAALRVLLIEDDELPHRPEADRRDRTPLDEIRLVVGVEAQCVPWTVVAIQLDRVEDDTRLATVVYESSLSLLLDL